MIKRILCGTTTENDVWGVFFYLFIALALGILIGSL